MKDMKKILSVLLAAASILQSVSVSAEILYGSTREQESTVKPVQEEKVKQNPVLPENILKKLNGTAVLKVGKAVIFKNGEGEEINIAPFFENDKIFVPLAKTAEFFGKKAVWNENERTVSVDGAVIHPSDNTKIIAGNTMITVQALAELLGIKYLRIDNDIVIFGIDSLDSEAAEILENALLDTFYVTAEETGEGDGSIDNPYGGIQTAVKKLRERTKDGMFSDIDVYLRGGLYSLTETLQFTPEDSGKNSYTITYRSYPGETAELVGAKEVTNWKEYKDGIYKAKLDAKAYVNMVYENDNFGVKARYPNIGEEFRESYAKSAGYNTADTRRFYFNNGDVPYMSDTSGLQVAMFGGGAGGLYNWVFEVHNATVDYRQNMLTMDAKPRYDMGKGSRYFVQGALGLLDTEGEFYYEENTKTLYYKPYSDNIYNEHITYGTTEYPIKITGTADNQVENLAFIDLKIGKSNRRRTWGEGELGANEITYSKNISFIDCEFLGCAQTALQFRNCNDCTVSGNYMHDLGEGAVTVNNTSTDGDVVYQNIVITNNYIENIGLIKRDARGIILNNADRNTVAYNTIKRIPRAGISFGTGITPKMKVGQTIKGVEIKKPEDAFPFINTRENYIAFNDISECMTDTQDGGPIYTWAAGRDNVIENNHIHDSNIYFSIGYGIYGDDATMYAVYKKNIVDNLQKEGGGSLNAAIITKGVGHSLINNFILNNPNARKGAYSTETKLVDSHNHMVYRNNITMNSSDQLHGQWKWYDDRFDLCDYNLYYNDSGKYLIYNNDKAKNLEEWKKINTASGYMDTQSISGENPNFVDYDNGDYRLRYDSPAYRIGIEDIDQKNIGVTEDFKFADTEEKIKTLYLETKNDGLSANVRLNAGEKTKINASARTVNGYFANLENAKITYSSDNESIAAVNENGEVTAISDGIAQITVKAEKNGKEISSVLFVLVNDGFESIKANAAQSILDAGTHTTTDIISVAASKMGYAMPVTQFTYKSLNEKVATVSKDGKITAQNPGVADITVSATYKGVTRTATVTVTVLNGILKNIDLSAEKVDRILIGEEVPITVAATLTTDQSVNIADCKVTYESDDESILTVDENGVIKGVGEGIATVTVYVEKDGYKISNTIKFAIYEKYSGTLKEGFKQVNFGNSYGYADFVGDKLLLRSSGKDFWGAADDGYYLYKEYKGKSDISLEMTVDSLLQKSSNTSVGLTIREAAEADSRNVTIRVTAGGGIICLWRDEKGGGCDYKSFEGNGFPVKMKIEKSGALVSMYIDKGKGYELLTTHEYSGTNFTAGITMFAQAEDNLSTEANISNFVINE